MFIRPHVSREFKIHSLNVLRLDYESNPKDLYKCPVRGHWFIQIKCTVSVPPNKSDYKLTKIEVKGMLVLYFIVKVTYMYFYC